MTFADFDVRAVPRILEPLCPMSKCRGDLIEIDNGWFSKAWWCPKCEKAFVLGFVKIKNPDRKVIDAQLAEIKEEKEWRASRRR